MNYRAYQWLLSAACALSVPICTPLCHAHFLWLKTIDANGQQQAFLFFGETATDEAYHLPERLVETDVWRRSADGKREKLRTESLETDERIGKVAPLEDSETAVLEATRRYGIYGKSLLVYYAKHVRADSVEELNGAGTSKEHKLDIVPRASGNEVELTVLWEGKPLPEAKVSVAVGDAQAQEQTTDDAGSVKLQAEGEGLVAVLTNHLDKEQSGELDGQEYAGVLHYASLTFKLPKARGQAQVAPRTLQTEPVSELPPLPEAVSSFGAAIADGWLYVYSGHTGDEHEHSAANLSKHFRRIQLDGGSKWIELPMQTPLQGLALVSHDGKIYRIGGLDARNATLEDEEDLHSVDEFAEYDPASGKWRSLEPLPAPRSSHNAALIGDRLYVVGGWHLAGESPGDWQADALVYDFADPEAGWQKLPQPPFTRRALAASHWDEQLVAIGGMDENSDVSQRVDFFDPRTGKWSQGPELPGAGRLSGFGSSACNLEGRLYVCGLRGVVFRLNETGSAWEEAGRLAKGRFFHQLLPADDGRLLAIGGASRTGHLADAELIDVGGDVKKTSHRIGRPLR